MALATDTEHQAAKPDDGSAGGLATTGVALLAGTIESVRLVELGEQYGVLRLTRPGIVAALRRSIEQVGLLRPLLANLERNGKLVLLDGYKRLRALRDLERRDAAVRVVQLDAAASMVALVGHNAAHRGLCELEQGWVVRALVRDCGLKQSAVAVLLGHHKSWVCRRLALCTHLEDCLQQDIRLGLLSATMARELARLPRGNQAPVAASLQRHRLGSRQAAKLVDHALRCRTEPALAALLRDPWPRLVVRRDEEPSRDARLGEVAEALRRRLMTLESAAGWWHQSVQRHPLATLSPEELAVLGELAATTRSRCEGAMAQLAALLPEVSP